MTLNYMNTPEYQLNQANRLLEQSREYMNMDQLREAMVSLKLAGELLDTLEEIMPDQL